MIQRNKKTLPDVAAVGWLTAGLGELKAKVDQGMVYIALALAHGDHLPDAAGGEQ